MGRAYLVLAAILFAASPAQAQVSWDFKPNGLSLTVAQNFVEKNLETQRFFLADSGPFLFGYVQRRHDKPDLVAIAALPLVVSIGPVRLSGGGWLGSAAIPSRGTHANFAARLEVELASRLTLTWLHLSNANLGDQNPASDAFGFTWRFK
jgi:hypothetical protein